MRRDNTKVHFFYVTFILCGIIITLITVNWTTQPKFVDFLSAAATITSLVLGILAIIYSYISGGGQTETIKIIEETSIKLNESADDLKNSLGQSRDIQNESKNQFEYLGKYLTELGRSVELLKEKTNSVEQAITNISQENYAAKAGSQSGPAKDGINTTPTKPQISNFLGNISPVGLSVLYASALAFKRDKPFIRLSALNQNALTDRDFGYQWGFMMATAGMSFYEVNVLDRHEFIKNSIIGISNPAEGYVDEVIKEWKVRLKDSKNPFYKKKDKIIETMEFFDAEDAKKAKITEDQEGSED